MYTSERLSKKDSILLNKVKRELFTNPAVDVHPDVNQEVMDNGSLILGCRAGISVDIFNSFEQNSPPTGL